MRTDPDEIRRALRAFFLKDDVFEIRVLDAVTGGNGSYVGQPHVESGYFDYDHIDGIPAALDHIKYARGVYVTVNPVDRSLLARAANRIRRNERKTPSTNDNDIIRRRWLLIDCDAERKTDISSTDEEHIAAELRAKEIRRYMSDAGWPLPIMTDSGNGAQLMYAIDLPVEDEGIVSRILHVLSDLSDSKVKIDTTVCNPSRIWRLPGTMNCKGDDIPERPHRMCRIIDMPESVELVSYDQLIDACRWGADEPEPVVEASSEFDFDLDVWIREHCPELGEPQPWNGGRKWVFDVCPFDPSHTGGSAVLLQLQNGAISFRCLHNHCSQYDWHSLRDLREPDWREKRNQPTPLDPSVDISGITGARVCTREEDDEEPVFREERSSFIPMPDELYDIQGIVKSVMDTTMRYAPIPNRPLALGGALSLMSLLCSRKVVSATNATPNVYILLIEDSGNGKNFPRIVNKEILYSVGMDMNIADRIGSGAGLEDNISGGKALLWQNDEFQYLLADMGVIRREDNNNSLSQYVLTYYTEANSIVKTRSLAGKPGVLVSRPHLVILGTTTPPEFFDALTERVLRNGLFARMNVIVGEGLKAPDLDRVESVLELDDDLLARVAKWRDARPAGSGNMDVKPFVVRYTDEAIEYDKSMRTLQYEKRKELENDNDSWKGTLWTRFREMANRYALIYACSAASEPLEAVITLDAVKWGAAFVKWDIENRIRMIEHSYFRSEYEKQCMKVIDIMMKWHTSAKNNGKGMPSGVFNVKTATLTPQQKRDVISGLVAQRRLLEIPNVGRGGGCKYYLPQFYNQNKTNNDNNGQNMTPAKSENERENG